MEDDFHAAADYVGAAAAAGSLADADLLALYGLYKQATCGPCTTFRPAFYDLKGRSKWAAWNNLGDLPQEQAQRQYVDLLSQRMPDWRGPLQRGAQPAAAPGSSSASTEESAQASGSREAAGGSAAEASGEGSGAGGGRVGKAGGAAGPVVSMMADAADEPQAAVGSLHHFASQGDARSVQYLLDKGVPVDERDSEGCTALHWAADRGCLEVVAALLARGADANVCDNDGQTPLHYAALCEQRQVYDRLLQGGADAAAADHGSQTAGQLAPPSWDSR